MYHKMGADLISVQLNFSFWSSDFPLCAFNKSKIKQTSQKSIPTLQYLRASLYSLFLMQSRAFFKAVLVSFVAVAILKTFAGLGASGNYDQQLLCCVTRHRMSHRNPEDKILTLCQLPRGYNNLCREFLCRVFATLSNSGQFLDIICSEERWKILMVRMLFLNAFISWRLNLNSIIIVGR